MAQFLSDEWVAEAKKIQDEFRGKGTPPAQQVQINLVITDVPFGDGNIDAHIDTSNGELDLDLGHFETATTKLTTDYETAKQVFIEQNPQAGMQAFMTGKVQIAGDMTKVMAIMQAAPDPVAMEMAGRLKDITD